MNAENELKDQDQQTWVTSVFDILKALNKKIDDLTSINSKILEINEEILKSMDKEGSKQETLRIEPDTMQILSLPSALRKTIMVLYHLEQATADDLAKETKRLRAVESAAANELVRMGYIKKRRVGRDVYFYIEAKEIENLG